MLSDDWNEDVHGFQNADLSFITLSPKDASQLECDTSEQSGSAKWQLERAKRITTSQFGQVIKRKAALNKTNYTFSIHIMYLKYTTLGILQVYYVYSFSIHMMYTFCSSNLEHLEVYKKYTSQKSIYL